MGGFGFGGLGCGRGCDDRWRGGCGWGGGCGGFDGGCGRGCGCDDDRSIRVITAVRSVCARGDGCFDGGW
jgi:hypothetical protein